MPGTLGHPAPPPSQPPTPHHNLLRVRSSNSQPDPSNATFYPSPVPQLYPLRYLLPHLPPLPPCPTPVILLPLLSHTPYAPAMAVGSVPCLPQLAVQPLCSHLCARGAAHAVCDKVTIQGGTQESAKSRQELCPSRTEAQSWHRAGSVFLEHRVSVAEGGTLLELWWFFSLFFFFLPPSFPFPNTPKGK